MYFFQWQIYICSFEYTSSLVLDCLECMSRAGGMAQIVEHLLRKCKVLTSNPRTTTNKKYQTPS
jgi:hypothetical protein